MANLEKAIKGLECCILRDPDDHARCSQCPYEGDCVNRLKMDALSLLKAQELRVMTMHDWETSYVVKMPVWIEWSESARGECADCEKVDGWAVLNVDEFVDVISFGGRCWTSRPTDEQRKAVKWDDSNQVDRETN